MNESVSNPQQPEDARPDIDLGDKCSDKVTDFTGIATGMAYYINGCVHVCLTPKVGKDGVLKDSQWFDIERLAIKKRHAVEVNRVASGGPAHPSDYAPIR